jgi:hypothetical protein
MKKPYTISRITDRVYCKEQNPYGIRAESGWYPNDGTYGSFEEYRRKWEQAEKNLKEYPLSEESQEKHVAEMVDEAAEKYPNEDFRTFDWDKFVIGRVISGILNEVTKEVEI